MKKLLLSLASLSAIVVPAVTVISCQTSVDTNKVGKTVESWFLNGKDAAEIQTLLNNYLKDHKIKGVVSFIVTSISNSNDVDVKIVLAEKASFKDSKATSFTLSNAIKKGNGTTSGSETVIITDAKIEAVKEQIPKLLRPFDINPPIDPSLLGLANGFGASLVKDAINKALEVKDAIASSQLSADSEVPSTVVLTVTLNDGFEFEDETNTKSIKVENFLLIPLNISEIKNNDLIQEIKDLAGIDEVNAKLAEIKIEHVVSMKAERKGGNSLTDVTVTVVASDGYVGTSFDIEGAIKAQESKTQLSSIFIENIVNANGEINFDSKTNYNDSEFVQGEEHDDEAYLEALTMETINYLVDSVQEKYQVDFKSDLDNDYLTYGGSYLKEQMQGLSSKEQIKIKFIVNPETPSNLFTGEITVNVKILKS
ncbi:hypothetical protein EELLY_v1c06410 [Entomoplasma ellychniae]|uniref:Lipoprotein n=1 Tax=Entomoplasma ellychniae TaxID=2114 RepID=A0A8E2QYK0_9MOLU|nr:hypothetical protein [Entomoplasma ellychniae]PPE04955.1 hypothetical protein EELLY_v1c06410 [Entomoplasma ellychniae]